MPSSAAPTRSRSSTSHRSRCATACRPGVVYPAERIDAALSNYFRLGNLTALRELALLWLADEVDSALKHYRAEHGIEGTWQARERVVVALTGGPEGETLIRRGARIAARSAGGELLAVHVSSQDGLRSAAPGALAAQRTLVESLGGTYHQVVGDDVPRALVEFARSVERDPAGHRRQPARSPDRRGRRARASARPSSASRATSTCTSSRTPRPATGSRSRGSPGARSACDAACSASPSRSSAARC